MRPVPSREASAPTARVLIVDDDVSVTELFARMLRLEGFEVWAAHSADEGLSLAQSHRPHAVILDLRMPLTSGVQVLRSLRAIPGMQHTPVTIVTGDYYLAESQTAEIKSPGSRCPIQTTVARRTGHAGPRHAPYSGSGLRLTTPWPVQTDP